MSGDGEPMATGSKARPTVAAMGGTQVVSMSMWRVCAYSLTSITLLCLVPKIRHSESFF